VFSCDERSSSDTARQKLRSGDAVDLLLYKLVQEFSRSVVQYFRLAQQPRVPVTPAPAPEELYSFKPNIKKYVSGRARSTVSDGEGDGDRQSSGDTGAGARAGEIHDRLFRQAKHIQQKKEMIRDEFAFEADAECTFQPKINKSLTPSARLHRAGGGIREWGSSQSQGSTPRGALMSSGYDSEGDGQGMMRSDFFEQL
jgi:hypothetical protein